MSAAVEFPEEVVEPRSWRIRGVGPYRADVDVVSLDAYHELAAQSESFKRQCMRWAQSEIKLRKAIEQHKAAMEKRFATDHDLELWTALDAS